LHEKFHNCNQQNSPKSTTCWFDFDTQILSERSVPRAIRGLAQATSSLKCALVGGEINVFFGWGRSYQCLPYTEKQLTFVSGSFMWYFSLEQFVSTPGSDPTSQAATAFTPSAMATVYAHTLSAVAHMHAAGVVHRDLKPMNVLLKESWDFSSVRVCDMGMARHFTTQAVSANEGTIYCRWRGGSGGGQRRSHQLSRGCRRER
jgi:serine/threonine protein kinase